MSRRGFTLVEQMITVAIIGIGTLALDTLSIQTERAGLAELERARAGVLLEYHARQLSTGQRADPDVHERLTASLPEAKVERASDGEVVTLTVTWRAPTGPQGRRALTIFPGGKR